MRGRPEERPYSRVLALGTMHIFDTYVSRMYGKRGDSLFYKRRLRIFAVAEADVGLRLNAHDGLGRGKDKEDVAVRLLLTVREAGCLEKGIERGAGASGRLIWAMP